MREGFTTGTAAAAAAKAACLAALGLERPDSVDTPLPPVHGHGGRLTVAVAGYEDPPEPDRTSERVGTGIRASAWVVKDGGDDPDVTHGCTVRAVVRLDPSGDPLEQGAEKGHIVIEGGKGVGRVTLPGLPVEVGHAAINPEPMAQIRAAVAEALAKKEFSGIARVTIEVDQGEEIAKKTMNPRLGIVGGVSILGTRGIVKPFSHEAWLATIKQGLAVARAGGATTIVLSTGRRSETFLRTLYPALPAHAFVQAADFFEAATRGAADQGLERIVWGCFFGKLVKMAQGLAYTHAKSGDLDLVGLARVLAQAGADEHLAQSVAKANTARQVLGLIQERDDAAGLLAAVAEQALSAAQSWLKGAEADEPGPDMEINLFDFDGVVLARATG